MYPYQYRFRDAKLPAFPLEARLRGTDLEHSRFILEELADRLFAVAPHLRNLLYLKVPLCRSHFLLTALLSLTLRTHVSQHFRESAIS
jgi:hypothetical protein